MPKEFSIPHSDPVAVVESNLHSMFINTFSKEEVRKYFGYSHISPFYSEGGFPGWYLWFDEQPGAYGIFITEAVHTASHSKENNSASIVATRLRVEYYPSPEERTFEHFSYIERTLRVSNLFDETGTPTLEGRQEFDEGVFLVGYLEFMIHPDIGVLHSVLASPNKWIDIRSEGLKLPDQDGNSFQAVDPGEIDREVPCWGLSRFLFDKLTVGYLFWQKCSPSRVNLYEKDMPEFVIKSENQVELKYEFGLRWYTAQAIFNKEDPTSISRKISHNDMDWRNALCTFVNQNNHEVRLLSTFKTPTYEFSAMGFSNWWAIRQLDLQSNSCELCSCYTTH